MVSHLGPPTAASRTASEALQASSVVVGQGGAVGVDRGAAEQLLVVLELAEGVEHPDRGPHDLGADAVSGEGDDRGHGRDTVPGAAPRPARLYACPLMCATTWLISSVGEKSTYSVSSSASGA